MALEFVKVKGLKKIYGVTADYQATRDGWELFEVEAKKLGASIVGNDFAPLGNRDYSVIVDKIAKSDADSVAVFVTGNDAVTFLKQSGQVGLGKTKTQFGPVLQDETLAAAVGPAAVGTFSGVRYHFTADSPANKTFVEKYRAKFGEWPSSFAGEAYDGMSWWLDVVDSTKSWDKEKWVEAFAASTRDNSLEGKKVMRACDHQAAQVGLWGVVKQGKDPLPALTMEITNVFPPEKLFDPC
jgi:ABC-type branched-subunit amino acid transport system substrate-binding protein